MTTAKTIQENRTRVQKAKELHEQKNRERADKIANTKAAYQSIKDHLAFLDLAEKAKSFVAYHQKIAQDGVGARPTGYKLEDGTQETETYYLMAEKRVNELERAAGIQELIDYFERQTKTEVPTPNPDLGQKVADSEE